MSIFKNLFNKEEEKNQEPEDNFNKLLRKIDRDRYNNEGSKNIYLNPETAYDIIAIINKFEHEKLNIYIDENGERWIRTRYGFESTTIHNKNFEISQLKDEIKARENEIYNLKLRYEKMLKVVEHEQSLNINYREKISKQNSQAFFRLIRSKEAKKIRKALISINKIIINNFNVKLSDYDLINNTDVTKALIKSSKENIQLKQTLIDSHNEIEKLLAFISASTTSTENPNKD